MIAAMDNVLPLTRVATPPLGFEEAMLPLSAINVDNGPEGYQRPLGRHKVAIMIPYNVSLGGTIAVNRRPDGTLYCFDGRHRMEAAWRTGYSHIPARVYHLTRPQEARYFIELNWATHIVSPGDKFRAMVVAEDPETCAIKETIESHGFRIDYTNTNGGAADALCAVDTARALCTLRHGQDFNVAPFGEVLDLIGAAWQGQPHNATIYILRATAGVRLQARRIGRVIDPATFKDRVGLHTPALVTRAGGQLAKIHNVPLWRGIGQKMIDELNMRLRGDSKHRIPPLI